MKRTAQIVLVGLIAAVAVVIGAETSRAKRDTRELARGLTDWHRPTRLRTAFALAHARTSQATDVLLEALHHDEACVRETAAEALGETGDPRAVEPLIRAVRSDPSSDVRTQAVWALGDLRDSRAFEPLLQTLLTDEHGFPGMAAATVLPTFGRPELCDRLVAVLRDGNEVARSGAAVGLGALRDPRAVQPLIRALQDPRPGVLVEVIKALHQIGDERATEAILSFQRDRAWPIRESVAAFLWVVRRPEGVALLTGMLGTDEESEPRAVAAWALGAYRDSRAVEALIAALPEEVGNSGWLAAMALGEIGDTKAIGPLTERLGSPNEQVRLTARVAIRAITHPECKDAIAKDLTDPERPVAKGVTRLMMAAGDPWTTDRVAPLVQALGERSDRVYATDVLTAIENPAVGRTLVTALGSGHADVRSTAALALGWFRDEGSRRRLMAAVADPDSEVRANAAFALGHRRDQGAIDLLIGLLKDSTPHVRGIAARALRKITGHDFREDYSRWLEWRRFDRRAAAAIS